MGATDVSFGAALQSVGDDLCRRFSDGIRRLGEIDVPDRCEILLCAKDLGIHTRAIEYAVGSLAEELEAESDNLILRHLLLRHLVLVRFDAAREQRRRFFDHWVNREHFRGQNMAFISVLVNMALEDPSHLTPAALRYVREWYLRRTDFRSDRVAAWMPYGLRLAGYVDEARSRATHVLDRREPNGSWGHELGRTVACAYALARSGLVVAELDPTIAWVVHRLAGGAGSSVAVRTQTLKLLHVLNRLPPETQHKLRQRLSRPKVFISYSRRDSGVAERVRSELDATGEFDVWVDSSGIALGEEWPERLAEAINQADLVVMLVSQSALQSDWFLKEIVYAVKRRKPVVALHVEPAGIPDKLDLTLGNIQQLALHEYPSITAAIPFVVQGLRRQLSR